MSVVYDLIESLLVLIGMQDYPEAGYIFLGSVAGVLVLVIVYLVSAVRDRKKAVKQEAETRPAVEAVETPPPVPMEDLEEAAVKLAKAAEDLEASATPEELEALAVEEPLPVFEEEEEPEEPEEEPLTKEGLFARLKQGLSKTRGALVERIDSLLSVNRKIDEDLFEELEEALVTADIGIKAAYRLLESCRLKVDRGELSDVTALKAHLMGEIKGILLGQEKPLEITGEGPFVIMVCGVNGVGKTTTIGKLAKRFADQGKKTMLVAADTFRAAAIEQLEIWADRVGVDFIRQKSGADPSAVAFDGIHAAVARKIDIVIVDTAGRLHTKSNLMEELKKVKRIVGRELPGAPQETLLVLDATTGQNAIQQAKQFHEALELTGIIVSKLDGTAKGGVIVGVSEEIGIPIRFIGIGERLDDLREFHADLFVQALFE